ncbi:MAG: penicillin-binding protein [Candidatus Improbicoccus devescovinae]|nr:MAG: penicillin-binding protein [Candidatus Improbicoccus devescovinae]
MGQLENDNLENDNLENENNENLENLDSVAVQEANVHKKYNFLFDFFVGNNENPSVLYSKKRVYGVILSVCAVFLLFVCRLVDWQLINNNYYMTRAASANTYFLRTDAVRGEIFDCDGVCLAVNKFMYRAVINRLNVPDEKENELIAKVVDFIMKLGNDWQSSLPIFINENNEFVFKENQELQIKNLRKNLKISENARANDCIELLAKKFKCENFNYKDKYSVCSVKYGNYKLGITSKAAPLTVCDDINKNTMIILSEGASKMPGINISTVVKREYLNSKLAPHIIGFTGVINNEEYEKYKEKDYNLDSKIGKSGVEAAFESELHGHSGTNVIQLSRDGNVLKSKQKVARQPGKSIFLTLSSRLQNIANESLARNISIARNTGASDCRSGAVVLLKISDFSVLAAATYPSFDLDLYMNDKNYYNEISNDKSLPLFNRAFIGTFAPGSIFKPLVACAALEEGVITDQEIINCNGAFNFYPKYTLHCMGVHGNTNLKKAMAKSCNVYFAELGRRLGATTLANYAKKFGLGVKTGIEVSESEGVLTTPEHSKLIHAPWYNAMSSQAAIGQANTAVSPLQLAAYTATLASGNRYKTHILNKVTDYTQEHDIRNYESELIESQVISEENLKIIREDMREVVLNGTASDFRNFRVPIAAKTGTAQNKGSDHTTFICFAPYENPEIAIAVVVANGIRGSISKNVARDLLNAYFS